MKDRLARYTMTVPITFSFKAASDCEVDKLYKLADAYLDMCLATGTFEVGLMDISRKDVIFSAEERDEMDKWLDDFILKLREIRR